MNKIECPYCHHKWIPRVDNPVMCPRCHRLLNPSAHDKERSAHDKVRNSNIVKPDCCESCGSYRKLHAHHDDYNDKLSIKWLCVSCHKTLHIVPLLSKRIPIEQYGLYLQQELAKLSASAGESQN